MKRGVTPIVVFALLVAACGGGGSDAVDDVASGLAPADTTSTTESPIDEEAEAATTSTSSSTSTTSTTTSVAPGPTGEELQALIETDLVSASGTPDLLDRMDELAVPGLAVVVVRDGETVASFGAGTTPAGDAMTPATISQVGSVSKPVAALVALSLAAEGAVDLDTDVETLLTSFVLPPGAQSADNPVTIAGLLAHAAGTNVDGFLGYQEPSTAPSLVDVLAGSGDSDAIEVVTAPGAGYSYSGGGYQLMEQTLIDVTGLDWDSLARAQVFGPLGMDDSFYALDPDADRIPRVTGGTVGGSALPNGWQAHPENAAAGLWTTAADLGTLLGDFSRTLAGADDGLLPVEWARLAVTPAADAGGGAATAQGFFVDDLTEPTTWFHGGRNIGYTSEILGATDGSFAVVVVTNAFPDGSTVAREIIQTVDLALRGAA